MADAHTILSTIFYCLWWPTAKILAALGFILSPFWVVTKFAFLPAAHLLHGIYVIVSFPLRLHVLERIETIYIWVGVAALIGCIAGTILFLIFKFLTSAFKIDGATRSQPSANGRTVKEFRAARRVKKEPHAGSPSGPRIDRVATLRKRGLSSHPILEEESEF